jgi:enoyl-CoA hydratase/carnithine racemase
MTKDEFMQQGIALLAKRIASEPPLALRMAKRCMVKAKQGGLEEAINCEEGILSNFEGQTIRIEP